MIEPTSKTSTPEWWAREIERAANGAPSRADAPAAFIAEAVHRVLIDDTRARARGIGRDEKGALEIVDLADQHAAAGADDTASAATYEALVHRVLTLIQGRLSERETRVFVWSFLYLQPSEVTAEALGLTHPRVKKDRKKIATKVGGEVWSVLAGELDLCAVYDEKALPAIFEILTVHVEDCPVCGAALGGVRRGALAIFGPEMLVLGAGAEHVTHGLSDLLLRVNLWLHRGTEMVTAMPPQGRTAAAVAVAATAVAGGVATVPKVVAPAHHAQPRQHAAQPSRVARATPSAAAPTVAPTATATTRPAPAATSAPRRRVKPQSTPAAAEKESPAPSFEDQQAAPVATAAAAPAADTAAAPAPDEFGFEP